MSFWKKIGLIDKNDFNQLLSVIENLKEDNRIITEKNCQLTGTLINANHEELNLKIDAVTEKVVSDVDDIISKFSMHEIKKIEGCENKIERVVKDVSQCANDNLSVLLSDTKKAIEDTRNLVKTDIKIANKEMVDECFKHTEEIGNRLSINIENSAQRMFQTCDVIDAHVEMCAKKEDIFSSREKYEKFLTEQTNYLEKTLMNKLIKQDNIAESNLKILKGDFQLTLKTISAQHDELLSIMDNLKCVLDSSYNEVREEAKQMSSVLEFGMLNTAKKEDLETILGNMELVQESMGNLWKVMKAIWVDALLEDVEKCIK